MGIKGLRKSLSNNQLREGHVKEFAGKRVACDGFAWLQKGAFGCALQLATGQKTTKHLDFCLHMVFSFWFLLCSCDQTMTLCCACR